MKSTHLLSALLPLSLLALSGAARADGAALLKCRTIADVAARVACYDAIPVDERQAAATPSAPAGAAAPAQTPEQRFGMEQVKTPRPESAAPRSIESTVQGNFSGWGPNSLIKLANGQVWRVVDGSSADLAPMADAKVRIVRNVFGTMFLEVEGSNNSAKVRRVQ